MSQVHIIVSTHQGKIYDELTDYIVISSKKGEFAILPNHVAIITTISEGFIKLVRKEGVFFIALVNGALEFHDNVASIIAQEAFIGRTKEKAKEMLLSIRQERLEHNRKVDAELEIAEHQLKEQIKEVKAGNL